MTAFRKAMLATIVAASFALVPVASQAMVSNREACIGAGGTWAGTGGSDMSGVCVVVMSKVVGGPKHCTAAGGEIRGREAASTCSLSGPAVAKFVRPTQGTCYNPPCPGEPAQ